MIIIPAIDIINGKCVRLTQGAFDKVSYYNLNPLDVAKQYEDWGYTHLHIVDLDGAKSNRIINAGILETIAKYTHLKLDFGGGVKSKKDLEIAFNAGAHQVTIGSLAVNDPSLTLSLLEKYGNDKIILGADCKNRKIATYGWVESSNLDVVYFLNSYEKKGFKYAVVTDIARDGMLKGPSIELYKAILQETDIQLVASGGVASLEDVCQLKDIGCSGVIIGKAFYEGKIDPKKLIELC